MKKKTVILLFLLSGIMMSLKSFAASWDEKSLPAPAHQVMEQQTTETSRSNFNLRVESRVCLDESGFKAERLSLALGGSITDNLSYYFFHNFHKPITVPDLMAATDQAYLKYRMNDNLRFRAGKFPINYGSWEYDAAPIDIYYYTRMFLEAHFFQPGLEAVYILPTGKDSIEIQACRSMDALDNEFDLFTFSASWRGNFGFFKPLYSFNVSQLSAHTGLRYDIALGNQFVYGPYKVELDIMNRYFTNRGTRFMESFGTCLKAVYDFRPWMDFFIKANYDSEPMLYNESRIFAGCEYFPVKGSRNVRIHAVAGARMGDDPSFAGTIGVKWNVILINGKK